LKYNQHASYEGGTAGHPDLVSMHCHAQMKGGRSACLSPLDTLVLHEAPELVDAQLLRFAEISAIAV
jgi:hypothetical protein